MARERGGDRLVGLGLAEALDGRDVAAVGLDREVRAGADRETVDEDRAGAAHLDVAGALGAGQLEALAQDVEQQLLGLDVERRQASVQARLDAHATRLDDRPRAGRGGAPPAVPRRTSSRP